MADPGRPPAGEDEAERVLPYLSRLQVERIAVRSEGSLDPVWEERPGAVLFIDATGFTELTNRYGQKGDQGVEELSELVNAYFGPITDLVLEGGGDVVAFGGDSAMAIWPVSAPEELAPATRAVARTALAIQAAAPGYEPQPGVSLGLRTSIGAGTLGLVEVGGVEDQWHCLVTGEPILQATSANARAESGEIVVSPEVWALIADGSEGSPLPGGGARLTAVPGPAGKAVRRSSPPIPPIARLRSCVPRMIVDRQAALQGRWLGEFRTVSAMFTNLAGARVGGLQDVHRLHRSVRSAQRILGRYGGVVRHLMVDDKGTTLVGVFGLPPLGHADNAARCVRAAMDAREELRAAGIDASFGVATGLAFCGVYGSLRRRDYTVLGPVMHRAARLMQGAGGRLFCDEATARTGGAETLVFDPLPPIRVKGESVPLAVYAPRLLASEDRPRRRSPARTLVGRVRERGSLSRSLAKLVEEGVGDVVEIRGEEGIGKSVLVELLVEEAREHDVSCLVGAGSEIERHTPYACWRPVVSTLLRSEGESPADAIRALLASEPDLLDLAPLLDAIVPTGLPRSPLIEGMKGEVRAENIRVVVSGLLDRYAAGRPVILVLEDVHWADSASWALALQVARGLESILLVLTARSAVEADVEHSQLREVKRWRAMELARLSRQEIRRLIADRLRLESVPDPIVDLVHERSEGHPFFATELAWALKEGRVLDDIGDKLADLPGVQWERLGEALGRIAIPDTVRGVVLRRLDRLSLEEQMTLRVASAIGTRFTRSLLAEVHPQEPEAARLVELLDGLVDRGILRVEDGKAGSEFAFRQTILREVTYDSMLFEQRRDLHRKIAERYERRGTGDPTRRDALLGHHWRRAGDTDRASEHLGLAAASALREHANREAVRLWTEALELSAAGTGTALRDARWRLRLGRAYVNLSKYEEALPHLEGGLRFFGERVPSGYVRAFPLLLVQIARQAIHRWRSERAVGRAADRREDLLRLVEAMEALLETHYVAGRRVPTFLATIRALNLAETAGPSPELARSYATAGAISGFVPLRDLVDTYGRLAEETARRVEDPATEEWVSLARGIYEAGIGRWDDSSRRLENVRAIAEKLGDRRRWEDATEHLAAAAYLRGEFDRALDLSRRLRISASGSADPADHGSARGAEVHPVRQLAGLRMEVQTLLTLGRLRDVPERFEELRFVMEERAEDLAGGGRALLLSIEARWAFRCGRPEEARIAAEKACDEMTNAPLSHGFLLELWAVAETLLLSMEEPASGTVSKDALEGAVDRLARHARVFPVSRPAAEIGRGLLSLQRGRRGQAASALERGRRAAADLGLPYFEGLALFHLGRSQPPGSLEREEQLDRAYMLFERMDAGYDLELVRRETGLSGGLRRDRIR